MELKEIQELAAAKSGQDNRLFYENVPSYMLGFHQGAKWEREREKWFDPEKVLPRIDSEVLPLIRGHVESIMVLAKTDCDQIEVAYYNFTTNQWSCEDKVISWSYIPN